MDHDMVHARQLVVVRGGEALSEEGVPTATQQAVRVPRWPDRSLLRVRREAEDDPARHVVRRRCVAMRGYSVKPRESAIPGTFEFHGPRHAAVCEQRVVSSGTCAVQR